MLLTLTTTHQPATDLGYLLHKNPAKGQSFPLSFGHAHFFYPEANEGRCTAALLLDVDPVAMVRGRGGVSQTVLAQYVNDRPYVASSFMSVAIARVLGSALDGRSRERPELAKLRIPLEATIEVLPCRGGEGFLHEVFEPLGYQVEAIRYPLDERFPEWGESPYYSVRLSKTTTLSELLTHLYVLIPVFDNFIFNGQTRDLGKTDTGAAPLHLEMKLGNRIGCHSSITYQLTLEVPAGRPGVGPAPAGWIQCCRCAVNALVMRFFPTASCG